MSKFALAATFAASVVSAENLHEITRAKEIERLNARPGRTWTAGVPTRFSNATSAEADFKALLGVKPHNDIVTAISVGLGETKVHTSKKTLIGAVSVPSSFDAAEQWPQCKKLINDIRDQGHCGSCWAFGGTAAASDRLCIYTNGTVMEPLSEEEIAFCSSDDGCQGGFVSVPWAYIKESGVASGGERDETGDQFADLKLCSNYALPITGSRQCPTKCDSDADADHSNFEQDRWAFTGDVEAYQGESTLQAALMKGGPIEVAFTVYSDFMHYTGGVYEYDGVSGVAGGHAVKLTGWGEENGMKYWKIANSWNNEWGEDGFFRIKRGNNECNIENQGAANDATGEWRQGTPPPTPGPDPADCHKQLMKDCSSMQEDFSLCLACVMNHVGDLAIAGCDSDQILGFCE